MTAVKIIKELSAEFKRHCFAHFRNHSFKIVQLMKTRKMDFFATGGFQQLFSDLDEHEIEHDYHAMAIEYNSISNRNTNSSSSNNNNTTLQQPESTWSTDIEATEIMTKSDDFLCAVKPVSCSYEIINAEDQTDSNSSENRLIDVSAAAIDWNNNSCQSAKIQLNEKQLQYNLDVLLPLSDVDVEADADADADDELANQIETDDFSTDYFITREMADWEDRFLDNYIEIPELIDFLPEKTPLCTDECELFLQESTKNLRLHRKRKQASSNSETPKAGYTCTFGDCRKVYAKPAHLKAHLRRHLGEKPYVCNWPDCTWRFSRSDELARHRRSHSGVKPYKCDYCTKCFARSDHLTKHRKVHERRLLAASKAGKVLDGDALPYSILTVRPGRKRKNQIC